MHIARAAIAIEQCPPSFQMLMAAGLAVITVMLLTTFLVSLLMIVGWAWHPLAVGTFWLIWTFIEAAYFSSNLEKVPKGAWFTLGLAAILLALCYIWQWSQELKLQYVRDHAVPLHSLLQEQRVEEGQAAGWSQCCPGSWRQLRLGSGGPAVHMAPGVGIYYCELLKGSL